MKDKCRQGAGSVLVIVLVMLFIIASATIGRSLFTSYVTDKTSKSVHGDLSFILAGNILKESHLRLSFLANSKDAQPELFEDFRSSNHDFTTQIPLGYLPASKEMLKQYEGYKLIDNSIEVKCLSKHPSSRLLPFFHDSYGLLELNASMRHSASGITRTKKEIFGYRTTLTGPPVPLASYTLMIADGLFLVNSYGVNNNANETIDEAISRLTELFTNLQKFATKGAELKIHLDDKADSATSLMSDKYEDAAKEVQKSIDILLQTISLKPEIFVKDFGEQTDSNSRALHYFAKPPMCFYSHEPVINLSDINLPDKLKTRLNMLDDKEKKLAEDSKKLKSFIDSKPQNLSPLSGFTRNLCQSTVDAAKEYEQLLLTDYKGFQDQLIEIGNTSYPDYLKTFMQLSKLDLLRKATTILSEEDDGTGRGINQKLNDFLDSQKRYNGLIFILNGTTEVVINRKFKGRVFLVIERDVAIERATVDDEKFDMVTIACLRHMTLKGPVEASLIPWLTFSSIPGLPIKGNIIFSRINFVSAPPEEVLAGNITYDPRLAGAAGFDGQDFLQHQYISLSPLPVAIDVERR